VEKDNITVRVTRGYGSPVAIATARDSCMTRCKCSVTRHRSNSGILCRLWGHITILDDRYWTTIL